MVPAIEIPGHAVVRALRHGAGFERTVLLTERDGTRCVTRIWNTEVPRGRLDILRGVAAGKEIPADAFPRDLAADFEGYRVRASLGEFPALPEVIDVGLLTPDDERSRPFITTRWVEGDTLRDALQNYEIDFEQRAQILRQLLQILADLHRHNVLHGDIKPENVIVSTGRTHLIDLDTLRHVEGPTDFAIVSQVTWSRVWPECQRDRPDGQRDYIASLPSDLWTYGLLVSELLGRKLPGDRGFPPELPPPWNAVLKACLRARPETRPSTEELFKAVHALPADLGSWEGDGDPTHDEATVRVPDRNPVERLRVVPPPRLTDRVDDAARSASGAAASSAPVLLAVPASAEGVATRPHEPTSRVADSEEIPPDPRWAKKRTGLWRVLLFVAPIVLLLALANLMQHDEAPNHPELAELRRQMQEHKSDPALNTLARARELATEAGAVAFAFDSDRPGVAADAWGLYALFSVWGRGWHFAGQGQLDPREFELHYARAGFALGQRESREALLARAIAAGAACRLGWGTPERSAYCDEARARTRDLLQHRLEGWFKVEVLWNAGMLERNEALIAWDAGNPAGYRRHAQTNMELCDAGESIVGEAPINGSEFAEHCIAAALAVGDPGKWLWWTEVLEESGARDRRKIADHIFRNAHPECRDQPFRFAVFRGRGRDPGPLEYCAFQALTAMQCPDRALQAVCGYDERGCELPEPGDVPWDLAARARGRAATASCFLD